MKISLRYCFGIFELEQFLDVANNISQCKIGK